MAWRGRLEAFNKWFTVRRRLVAAAVLFGGWFVGVLAFDAGPFLLIAAMLMLLNILPMMPAKRRPNR